MGRILKLKELVLKEKKKSDVSNAGQNRRTAVCTKLTTCTVSLIHLLDSNAHCDNIITGCTSGFVSGNYEAFPSTSGRRLPTSEQTPERETVGCRSHRSFELSSLDLTTRFIFKFDIARIPSWLVQ